VAVGVFGVREPARGALDTLSFFGTILLFKKAYG
jgi:hypothetical protein